MIGNAINIFLRGLILAVRGFGISPVQPEEHIFCLHNVLMLKLYVLYHCILFTTWKKKIKYSATIK